MINKIDRTVTIIELDLDTAAEIHDLFGALTDQIYEQIEIPPGGDRHAKLYSIYCDLAKAVNG